MMGRLRTDAGAEIAVSRIGDRFARLRAAGEKGLIPFIVAGDPDLGTTRAVMDALAQAGADVIELGVPFSDPLADGAVNEAAYTRALAHGVTVGDVLDLVRTFRRSSETPIALMTYANPIAQYGWDRFARDAAAAGVDGAIITDLPPEEAGEWEAAAQAQGVDRIFLLAPTSTPERVRLVAERSSGFIYCVSRTGVTGVREALPADLPEMIARIRALTDKPLAVGFGISSREQVQAVWRLADAAVVGSLLVQLIADRGANDGVPQRVGALVRELKG
jgi:tryptophan synthase alpha chain